MSPPDNPLAEGDIAASNVLPTFEVSLQFGLTEAELARELGWRREALSAPDARVSGASTYRHMELLFERPRYPELVVAAARAHGARSLGIVGLACKTMPDVGSALACHARYQALTNRTASYSSVVDEAGLRLRERRPDPRWGSVLLSDYAMLVAVFLLRSLTDEPVSVRAMLSRRPEIGDAERAVYEAALGAPIRAGAPSAELIFDPEVARRRVPRADPELEAYFRSLLESASPPPAGEPELIGRVRAELRDGLPRGQADLGTVARSIGLGERTVQRRLRDLGTSFQEVLDDTRRSLAEGYLRRPELTLAEIAYLLGYAEQASFFRACRRWLSTTPEEWRRR